VMQCGHAGKEKQLPRVIDCPAGIFLRICIAEK
jgi:hypothetical protein